MIAGRLLPGRMLKASCRKLYVLLAKKRKRQSHIIETDWLLGYFLHPVTANLFEINIEWDEEYSMYINVYFFHYITANLLRINISNRMKNIQCKCILSHRWKMSCIRNF